jgi:hypothetical protein
MGADLPGEHLLAEPVVAGNRGVRRRIRIQRDCRVRRPSGGEPGGQVLRLRGGPAVARDEEPAALA